MIGCNEQDSDNTGTVILLIWCIMVVIGVVAWQAMAGHIDSSWLS